MNHLSIFPFYVLCLFLNVQEHEQRLEGMVESMKDTEKTQKEEILHLKDEFETSVSHHKEVDASLQVSIR